MFVSSSKFFKFLFLFVDSAVPLNKVIMIMRTIVIMVIYKDRTSVTTEANLNNASFRRTHSQSPFRSHLNVHTTIKFLNTF